MAIILLVVIYITFIGVGVPDSVFGTAWPAIYTEFNVPVAYANFVTGIISGGTIVSSLLSVKLIRRFGTAKIVTVSTALTAFALLGFSISNRFLFLCIFSVPMGIGAGAIDTALNHYVALNYKAVHINFLHCFYGVGATLSPYLMARMLSDNNQWRVGYKAIFLVQLTITVITIAALPLWGKAKKDFSEMDGNAEETGLLEVLRNKIVRRSCLIFMGSCAIEYTCGVWGSTFLVSSKNMTAALAAGILTFYYIGIACGRFFSGLLSYKLHSWKIIQIGQVIIFTAIMLLMLPLPAVVSGAALFLIGLGNAPIFPNMVHLTPIIFRKGNSQEVMSIQMAATYTSIMLAPILFGFIAQNISISLFPYYVTVIFVIMIAAGFSIRKSVR